MPGRRNPTIARTGWSHRKRMKLLILGAGGQLGSEWRHLITGGRPGVDCGPDGDPAVIGDGITAKCYGSKELDITSESNVKSVFEEDAPDVIVNCAAYTAVDKAEEERDWAERVNHLAVERLARYCSEMDIRLVHYSTDYIFPGRASDRDRRPDGYLEEDEADPVNWYGTTKWRGEEAIRASGCRHLILRASWLCGRFGTNFVRTMLRLSRERDTFSVVGDQWGSPTYTDHLVKNTLALLQRDTEGTVHITSEGTISWYDFARAIFEGSGIEVSLNAIPTEAYPTAARRPRYSKLSTARLRTISGTFSLHWKEGLRELLTQLETAHGNH